MGGGAAVSDVWPDRHHCVRCNRKIEPGDYYYECRQAEEENGKTVIVVGLMNSVAHVDCPGRAARVSKMWGLDTSPTWEELADDLGVLAVTLREARSRLDRLPPLRGDGD